ncbi:hypothetical protein LR48_Vigan10g209800 [Vigna angularis]|uniref:CCHC-type domain-containing protein n=1 Tax=Phaseolus angularis TaxID=3914 RepID=A0A0L9VMB2_PHAAN|nr:hypothetical protein LR48_Vigan10g209800 [Vigna angularis]
MVHQTSFKTHIQPTLKILFPSYLHAFASNASSPWSLLQLVAIAGERDTSTAYVAAAGRSIPTADARCHAAWSLEWGTQFSCVSLGERDSSLTNARCHDERSLESVSGMHVADEERTSPPSHLLRSRFRHHRRTPGDKGFKKNRSVLEAEAESSDIEGRKTLVGRNQKSCYISGIRAVLFLKEHCSNRSASTAERCISATDYDRFTKFEDARASSEVTQRQLMEILQITRNISRASISSGNKETEWNLESFLQHHPSGFNEKCPPDEVERANVLEKNVTEVEQHMKQQQQVIRGTTSSRNNTNPRRTRRTPYARTGLPSISSGSQAQPLVAANWSEQQRTMKCFKCGGPHFRSSCPQLVEAKYCLQCGGSGHVENECNMGERAVLGPPNAGRGQPGRGG